MDAPIQEEHLLEAGKEIVNGLEVRPPKENSNKREMLLISVTHELDESCQSPDLNLINNL